jgi:hypothetical protein
LIELNNTTRDVNKYTSAMVDDSTNNNNTTISNIRKTTVDFDHKLETFTGFTDEEEKNTSLEP